ncbi:MAG: thymidine phosphorylase [Syntrophomonadaceae bacterium]|nr:thymidine phosphorylase [Syntrophomonadaceae bacterium]
MHMTELIMKKRDGGEHDQAEIDFLVQGISDNSIPDYQLAAWTMAVYFRGMTKEETRRFTMAMAQSGKMMDLSSLPGPKADKHSTGGVGDKATPLVMALVAAAGIAVAKMSGRGLGHTGGTIDKFESIPGFRSTLATDEFMEQLRRIGAVVAGQSSDLARADKRLYALRDVTGTLASIPLIASSVMSKKIAAGADTIVLDVKCGSGAFMRDLESARELALSMVDIGRGLRRRVTAVISNMDEPLGWAVGNSLEMTEAIDILKGGGPGDVRELSLVLAEQILIMAGRKPQAARKELEALLDNGTALRKFEEMVAAQGGKIKLDVEGYNLPAATHTIDVLAAETGWVKRVDALKVGQLSMELGAGRQRLGDEIDASVGVVLQRKIGDRVESGERIAVIHARRGEDRTLRSSELLAAFEFTDYPVVPPPLVLDIIS